MGSSRAITEYTPKELLEKIVSIISSSVFNKMWTQTEGYQTVHTFILRVDITNDHKMASSFASEGIFRTLLKLPRVFVPGDDRIVEGDFTFERGGLSFFDHDVLNALSELNRISWE